MTSEECLQLYEAMRLHGTRLLALEERIYELDPTTYFQSKTFFTPVGIIDKAALMRYENDLKTFLTYLSLNFRNIGLAVLAELRRGIGSVKLSDDPFQISRLVKLITGLRSSKILPAIAFHFDRRGCTTMVQKVLKYFEESEQARRDSDSQYQKKKQTAIQKVESRDKARKKKKELKKGDDADESGEPESIFDFDKHDPEFTLVTEKNRMDRNELRVILAEASYGLTPNLAFLIQALERGVGCHHAGLPRKYLAAVETLFRKNHLQLVFATGTLAMGINMPCKTSIFMGDSGNSQILQTSVSHHFELSADVRKSGTTWI